MHVHMCECVHACVCVCACMCVCVCWEWKEVDARQPNGRTTVLLGFPGKLPVFCCPDVILTEGTFILQSVLVWRINYGVTK